MAGPNNGERGNWLKFSTFTADVTCEVISNVILRGAHGADRLFIVYKYTLALALP